MCRGGGPRELGRGLDRVTEEGTESLRSHVLRASSAATGPGPGAELDLVLPVKRDVLSRGCYLEGREARTLAPNAQPAGASKRPTLFSLDGRALLPQRSTCWRCELPSAGRVCGHSLPRVVQELPGGR